MEAPQTDKQDKNDEVINEESTEDGDAKKKRGAARQLRSDDPSSDEDETAIKDFTSTGWKKADNSTIANRRIVKVTRKKSTLIPENINQSTEEAPSNVELAPSASITVELTPTSAIALSTTLPSITSSSSSTTEEVHKKEGTASNGEEKTEVGTFTVLNPSNGEEAATTNAQNNEKPAEEKKETEETKFTLQPTSFSVPSTGFSFTTSFTFSSTPIFGFNIAPPKESTLAPVSTSFEAPTSKPAVPLSSEPVSTGEEGEKQVHQVRAKLFVLDVSEGGSQWRERGRGNLKLNVADDESYSRLLMRMEGSLKLILNARLWPTMLAEKVGDKQIRFTASSIEKEGLACYLIRFASSDEAEELLRIIEKYKKLGGTETKSAPSSSSAATPKEVTKE